MYAKYPKPEDWENMRFSDEIHAGYSPEGHLWIALKTGTAMRDDIQHRDPSPQKSAPKYMHGRQLGGQNLYSIRSLRIATER